MYLQLYYFSNHYMHYIDIILFNISISNNGNQLVYYNQCWLFDNNHTIKRVLIKNLSFCW